MNIISLFHFIGVICGTSFTQPGKELMFCSNNINRNKYMTTSSPQCCNTQRVSHCPKKFPSGFFSYPCPHSHSPTLIFQTSNNNSNDGTIKKLICFNKFLTGIFAQSMLTARSRLTGMMGPLLNIVGIRSHHWKNVVHFDSNHHHTTKKECGI